MRSGQVGGTWPLGLPGDDARWPVALFGDEDITVVLVLLGDEDDPGGVSSSYGASARLSKRVTLLPLGERSTSGFVARSISPKLLGRRAGPSE